MRAVGGIIYDFIGMNDAFANSTQSHKFGRVKNGFKLNNLLQNELEERIGFKYENLLILKKTSTFCHQLEIDINCIIYQFLTDKAPNISVQLSRP